MREFLDAEGFLEIETPILTRSTPEGARDFLVPAPPPAGLLLRAAAVAAALQAAADGRRLRALLPDRRCFRDEDLRADRQPDFTQLDIEMSFVERRGRASTLNERLIAARARRRRRSRASSCRCRGSPYDEAIARFGTDKPDLRFGLELVELTDAAAARPSSRSSAAVIDGGGVVKGHQRRQARGAALGARRPDRRGPGARREGPRLGVPRGRRLALADREVPLRRRAGGAQRGARRRGGRPAAARRRPARGRERGARRAARSTSPSASS